MAYIFVSDGRAEADEYSNNRIWFDEGDPADVERAQRLAQRRREYIARRNAAMLAQPAPDANDDRDR
jgi:hypothetical protein